MAVIRDLVVIGGGAGGLVVASVAAQLGLDVVLINKEEAMKMLQAIRDRDLMRRTQKLNETRRRYRPVDRDW